MIKNIISVLIMVVFIACSTENEEANMHSGFEILNKSISVHDPKNEWPQLKLSIHIQEPRISNPSRYSIVKMDNKSGAFELIRNRENHLSKHVINEKGELKVYLDDNEEIEEELIEKYRLNPERNKVYREFYKMLYGLPMTLDSKTINQIGQVEECIYNSEECYKIPIELKEKLFSKKWQVFISKNKYEIKGIEIIHPEDRSKGERLYFGGSVSINGVNIPRTRHWHELANDEYSGSDIILKEIEGGE